MLNKKKLVLALGALSVSASMLLTGCGGSQQAATSGSSSGAAISGKISASGSTALLPLLKPAQEAFQDKYKDKGLVDHKVVVEPFVFIVDKANKVDNLTKDQVVGILTGKIQNWKDVGGDDQKITLIHRAKSSGSRATISDVVLKGANFTDDAVIQDSNGAVRAAIASTPGSIGYVDAPYADDSVKVLKFDGVEYSAQNIIDGKYPIYGYGHMYTKGEPTGAVKAFIDYILSDEFQNSQVEKLGFIPVSKMKK